MADCRWRIEGHREWIVAFQPRRTVPADQVAAFLEEGRRISELYAG
jgi:hypothetical protein